MLILYRAVTKHILATIPPDPSSDPQLIQSLLCSGETTLASLKMYQLDTWLAAHLGDVLDKMLLLVDDESAYDISLRNFFLLEYAELLQGSTQGRGLWKVVSGYLNKAGTEGKRRLGEHLMRVGLQLGQAEGEQGTATGSHGPERQSNGNAEGMDVDAEHDTTTTTTTTPQTRARRGKYDHMSEVLNACRELGFERERHDISRVIADQLIRQGEYGVASAMCMEANDVHGIGKLADRVVEVYIRHGTLSPSPFCAETSLMDMGLGLVSVCSRGCKLTSRRGSLPPNPFHPPTLLTVPSARPTQTRSRERPLFPWLFQPRNSNDHLDSAHLPRYIPRLPDVYAAGHAA